MCFDDGSLRVIDYKLGRLPDLDDVDSDRVYAHCAQQMLEAEDGRPHPVARRCTSRSATSASSRAGSASRSEPAAIGRRGARRRVRRRRSSRSRPASFRRSRAGQRVPVVPVRRRVPQGIPDRRSDETADVCLTCRRADADAGRAAGRPIRRRATSPSIRRNDVVLEASAGTGKTRVLVDRYVRLIEAGVDPRHILAITFTRKAAAEMRERVLADAAPPRRRAARLTPERWRALRDASPTSRSRRSTRSASGCCASFRSRPTSIPAFDIADETEMARFANEALDLTLRAARGARRRRRARCGCCSRA